MVFASSTVLMVAGYTFRYKYCKFCFRKPTDNMFKTYNVFIEQMLCVTYSIRH